MVSINSERYLSIEAHGVIGNMNTVALVGLDGRIDWFCFPYFDSPAIFCSLLDYRIGQWSVIPQDVEIAHKQFYWPETNILVTRYLSNEGLAEVVDYMPVGISESCLGNNRLIRKVHVIRGTMQFVVRVFPTFDFARVHHEITITERGCLFESASLSMELISSVPLMPDPENPGAVIVNFNLKEGDSEIFCFGKPESQLFESNRRSYCDRKEHLLTLREMESYCFCQTVCFWRTWVNKCSYRGRWRDKVLRSALALKLLCFEQTGAIVAAATCSLPEYIGGIRNWDYRYTWIRDAAFTIYAFLRIGFTDEATAFMKWLECRCSEYHPESECPLLIMYSIDGKSVCQEQILEHLEGYRGSKPVRVGNNARTQLQLDIIGELMDSIYLFNKYAVEISYDFWINLKRIIDWLCENWTKVDESIWEVRSGRQHFVYSKVMCWVAVDRALRLADKRSFPANRTKWYLVRDEIYENIMQHGWNDKRKSFIQYYGSQNLDSSNLIMPLVFFMAPSDPRMAQTLENIMKSPKEGGLRVEKSLLFRYDPSLGSDGVTGLEGTFNICSFWLIEALTRAGRTDINKLQEARLMFEEISTYANHLGLYSEQIGPRGEHLGNFPQALTHLSQISAAFNLDRCLSKHQ